MEITRCLETFHFLGGFCDQPGDRVKSRHVFLAALSKIHKGGLSKLHNAVLAKIGPKSEKSRGSVRTTQLLSQIHKGCKDKTPDDIRRQACNLRATDAYFS